ncbi:ATP-binding domain-containing protein [Methylorubrum rhodinum]
MQDHGYLYIGYPVIATPEGAYPIDALWISRTNGVVIFNLVEGRDVAEYGETQDESANKLETKLRSHKSLMRGRDLIATPNVITYAPMLAGSPDVDETYPLCNDNNLKSALDRIVWRDAGAFESAVSVIQSISTIRRGKRNRGVLTETSRGAKLKAIEDSIANLDDMQGRAVIETVEGVQRIRGLAGSGKTIVLALKAAYLHAQFPDWKIAVTFNTRSLKDQFKRLINTFVLEQSGEEPIWENLRVINAWGGPGDSERSGVYYMFCQANGCEYLDLRSAKSYFPTGKEFDNVCERALQQTTNRSPIFDVVLIDEAQDFAPSFLRMCYESLTENKRLVYAYDELQSLNEKSLPSPEEIFGRDNDGTPRVRFVAEQKGQPKQDIILEKCYRNSRPLLATAHALGFGIYRSPDPTTKTGLIQMFDQSQLWMDVGYDVMDGALEDGQRVQLGRSDRTSPKFLENHSDINDLIQFYCFDNKDDQAEWLAQSIKNNLTEDELQHDDIIVINPDPLTTRKEVGKTRRRLWELEINSHLAGVDTSADVFFDASNKSVAFTGVFRAKGNEAGMVYIINADDCAYSFGSLARVRNQLFTCITRSKAWVRVLGVGAGMQTLIEEFSHVQAKSFTLDFTYPTAEQRKYLNIVNRDMTEEEKRSVKSQSKNIRRLNDDVEAGRIRLEDLPEREIERLRAMLLKGPTNGTA